MSCKTSTKGTITVITDTLRGCVDCLLYCANGEHDPDITPEREAEVCQGVDSAAGFRDRYPSAQLVAVCSEDCDGSFSWLPCAVCGSRLGGDRHSFAVLANRAEVAKVDGFDNMARIFREVRDLPPDLRIVLARNTCEMPRRARKIYRAALNGTRDAVRTNA